MKCKICGYDIIDGQDTCPGCGTSVADLKQAGNIEYTTSPVEVDNTNDEMVVDNSSVDSTIPKVEEVGSTEVVEPVTEVAAPVEVVNTDNSLNAVDSSVTPVEEVMPVSDNASTDTTPVSPIETVDVLNEIPVLNDIAKEDSNLNVSQTAPVADTVTPVVEASPVADTVTPVVEANSVADTVTPVVEASPVADTTTPVVEASPVADTVTPVVETSPVADTTTPVVEANPVADTVTPVVEANPVVDTPNSVAGVSSNTTDSVAAAPISDTTSSETANLDASGKKEKKVKEKKVKEEKAHKFPVILVILIILILLIAGVGAYIYFVFGTPANVFDRTINSFKNTLTSNILVPQKGSKTSIKISFYSSGNQELDYLNKLKLTLESKATEDLKTAGLYFGIKYDESLLEFDATIKDDMLYLYSEDLGDKYYRISTLSEDMDTDINDEADVETSKEDENNILEHKEEMQRVIDNICNYLNTQLKNGEYTKQIVKSVYDNYSMPMTKYSMSLNGNTIENIIKEIYTNIKNDDQILSDLAIILDSSKDDIKNSIDASIENINVDIEEMNIVIYTDLTSYKFCGADITMKKADSTDTIKIQKLSNGSLINISLNNGTNEAVINTDTKKISLTIKDDVELLTANIDYNIEYTDDITIDDVSDYIDINELTEEEAEEITNKLLNNEIISKCVEYINSIMENADTSGSDYDYDYDSDYDFDMESDFDFEME